MGDEFKYIPVFCAAFMLTFAVARALVWSRVGKADRMQKWMFSSSTASFCHGSVTATMAFLQVRSHRRRPPRAPEPASYARQAERALPSRRMHRCQVVRPSRTGAPIPQGGSMPGGKAYRRGRRPRCRPASRGSPSPINEVPIRGALPSAPPARAAQTASNVCWRVCSSEQTTRSSARWTRPTRRSRSYCCRSARGTCCPTRST
mmetsp:Transcript_46486/g.149145  ORF Transcript_46486/g.149145 Transcript_46486/m.149145 type:complete len:204 (-) Transcript_46486:909-1520(-)